MSKKIFSAAVQTAALDARERDHDLTIKAVAKMFKVSTWTLRLYEWRGLIGRESNRGERVYNWRDCERIALIVKAKKARLALGQIVPVVKAMSGKASADVLRAGRERCVALIAALTEYDDTVADLLAELERIDWELAARLAGKTPSRRA